MKNTLLGIALTAGLVFTGAAQDRRDDRNHDNNNGRGNNNDRRDDNNRRGDNDRHDDYHFRPDNSARLRKSYKNYNRVDWRNRPHYVRGGRLPDDFRTRIRPVPVAVVRELPPPPPGYAFGYMDGYAVAYNPTTRIIGDIIDLAATAMR